MVARHDKYYFKDGNVVFQVGEKLYRIHKRLLVGSESSVFASMLSLPQPQNNEGQTDENPIALEGENSEQFEALMRILYTSILEFVLDIPIATYSQAMRIAIKYSMDDVQDAIIQVIHRRHSDIPQLAFIAEFPGYFSYGFAIRVFTGANSGFYPDAINLEPIMAYPALIALLMQYRERLARTREAEGSTLWLNGHFTAFGFKS